MYEISTYTIKNIKCENLLEFPRITTSLTYEEFFENYLSKNKPCVIPNISKNWYASNNWVANDKININYLKKYSDLNVCVSDCNERYFNAQKTEEITLGKYLTYFKEYMEKDSKDDIPLLYLKDWHLRRNTDDNFYTIPLFFASDWLNEYFSQKTDDDYMFVYMGPKGTWTPFHVDVFSSYSWSTNICGKKIWIFLPPNEEKKTLDRLGNLPYDISTHLKYIKHFKVIQNPGEVIFVPSGWYHQVWNLEDTISINHNWVNGCNVKHMWFSILENLKAVKKEIADLKDIDDWEHQCQIVLKASYGIDFEMFFEFLKYISQKRIEVLETNEKIVFLDWKIGINHCIFDLKKIHEVLGCILSCKEFNTCDLKFNKLRTATEELKEEITVNLCKYK